MNIDLLPQLQNYQTALLCIGILCLINLIQNWLIVPFAFLKGEQVPGMPIQGDHSLFSFRVLRTFSNSVENAPTFGLTLLLAILVGISAALTNWIAVIYVISRIAYSLVYYTGTGKVGGGPRTILFVVGALANMVLAIACIFVLLK